MRRSGPFIEAWAGWLGEPALGDDWLKVTGIFVDIGTTPANDLRASAAPYTGWAGFNYDTGAAARARQGGAACTARATTFARSANLAGHARSVRRGRPRDPAERAALGARPHQHAVAARHRADRPHGPRVTSHTNRYIYKRRPPAAGAAAARAARRDHAAARSARRRREGRLVTDNVPVSLFWPIWQVGRAAEPLPTESRSRPSRRSRAREALRCATENGAYLTFDEDRKGTLEPGKLADLAVLERRSADGGGSRSLRDITAVMTMVGGRIVYQTRGLAGLQTA